MKSPHSGQAHFAMGQGEFIALMAMLMALQALAIDVMLPALGVIARDLGLSDPNDRQLLIGVFLICSGLASLIPGSLSDRFGRKPVILVCLAAYFTVSLASALVTDFTVLLILREPFQRDSCRRTKPSNKRDRLSARPHSLLLPTAMNKRCRFWSVRSDIERANAHWPIALVR